jgi:hypothetical protein
MCLSFEQTKKMKGTKKKRDRINKEQEKKIVYNAQRTELYCFTLNIYIYIYINIRLPLCLLVLKYDGKYTYKYDNENEIEQIFIRFLFYF